ncbi:MAG: alpha/beta hydrolase-fold protein [candidate division WOR-3 bacterium]|nr:alpha/beta hydrolase-fold protein [candidate division WOR-3 bacterium]MCX7836339.1 alpha/beta hydrolase-fold protein [candidate division WOR-3 bacterium]MDW8113556.1 alpha/beta hydrolase-fold protein [candidate division WOR-3 bacterium]
MTPREGSTPSFGISLFLILSIFIFCKKEKIIKLNPEIPKIYSYRLPKNYNSAYSYPLVIVFHGYLSDENKSILFYDEEFFYEPNFILLSIRAPFAKRKKGYTWFAESDSLAKKFKNILNLQKSSLLTCEERVLEILGEFEKKYNIDPNRRYLWGLSLGGPAALHLGLKYPEIFSGIIASSPVFDTLILPIKENKNLKGLKVFLACGEKEKNILLIIKRTAEILKEKDCEVKLYIHPYGHTIDAKQIRTFQNFFNLSYTKAPEDDIDYRYYQK